jgi:2,3-diketo-5-methylthio-1-phosphopentane phosphatase
MARSATLAMQEMGEESSMHLFCDFDGTISVQDATDYVLERLALPEWNDIQTDWEAGNIGSAECMQRQIALINGSKSELDAVLDEIQIDPSFSDFVQFCVQQKFPVTVTSDGVDYFIQRILARHSMQFLPVVSNRLSITEDNGKTIYRLTAPYQAADCAVRSGMCKCKAVGMMAHKTTVYVGDGRSDFCVANKPSIVFAKSKLAEFCSVQHIPFFAYESFADVTAALRDALPGCGPDERTTMQRSA